MARNMGSASRYAFPKSKLVTDRFHVVRLVLDALQHLRIKYRWEAIEEENKAIELAKKEGRKYQFEILSNGVPLNNCLLAAGICYINLKKTGRYLNREELPCYLKDSRS